MLGEYRTGSKDGPVQVPGGKDDAVVVAAEVDARPEHAIVHIAAGRRVVRETDDSLPSRADQRLQYAIENHDAEFDPLPERHLPREMDLQVRDGLILDLHEVQQERFV